MSEAIERVRKALDSADRYSVGGLQLGEYQLLVTDLRELLAGYIPPEHHAVIRAALVGAQIMCRKPECATCQSRGAALAAMPKAGA